MWHCWSLPLGNILFPQWPQFTWFPSWLQNWSWLPSGFFYFIYKVGLGVWSLVSSFPTRSQNKPIHSHDLTLDLQQLMPKAISLPPTCQPDFIYLHIQLPETSNWSVPNKTLRAALLSTRYVLTMNTAIHYPAMSASHSGYLSPSPCPTHLNNHQVLFSLPPT